MIRLDKYYKKPIDLLMMLHNDEPSTIAFALAHTSKRYARRVLRLISKQTSPHFIDEDEQRATPRDELVRAITAELSKVRTVNLASLKGKLQTAMLQSLVDKQHDSNVEVINSMSFEKPKWRVWLSQLFTKTQPEASPPQPKMRTPSQPKKLQIVSDMVVKSIDEDNVMKAYKLASLEEHATT
jgi:hypothetical protein